MTNWRKSSYSSNGGEACVETASGESAVLVRDTTDRDGAILNVPADAWACSWRVRSAANDTPPGAPRPARTRAVRDRATFRPRYGCKRRPMNSRSDQRGGRIGWDSSTGSREAVAARCQPRAFGANDLAATTVRGNTCRYRCSMG
ncbi:MAG TPA: DUF397 domain-containing protein [Trebonia sp.]